MTKKSQIKHNCMLSIPRTDIMIVKHVLYNVFLVQRWLSKYLFEDVNGYKSRGYGNKVRYTDVVYLKGHLIWIHLVCYLMYWGCDLCWHDIRMIQQKHVVHYTFTVALCVKRFMSWLEMDLFWFDVLVLLHVNCFLSLRSHHSLRVGAVRPSSSTHGSYGQRLLRRVRRATVAGHRCAVPWLANSTGRSHFASAPAAFLLVVSQTEIGRANIWTTEE